MAKIRIKINRKENLADQVIAAFEGLAADAVNKTSEEAAAEAKALAPVRTGHLRDSIDTAEINRTEAAFGAQAEYAAYVELGTSKMAPRSYVIPAAINAREKLLKNLTEK